MTTIQTIIKNLESFINLLVPLVFAIAFIAFIWGVFQFFFAKAGDAEARAQGRTFIFWGIIAFAVMVSVWGLVNLAVSSLGLTNTARPDLPCFNSSDCSNSSSGTSGSQPTNLLPTSFTSGSGGTEPTSTYSGGLTGIY